MGIRVINYGQLEWIEQRQSYARWTLFPELSKRYVSGEGDDNLPMAMIIGEAPGAQEEVQGRPFVGPAGIILKRLMAIAGLYGKRTITPNCWLTNVVKFRPPRNRTPTDEEVRVFKRFLLLEWQAIGKPNLIIPVGGVALHAVLGKKISILKVAGQQMVRPSRTQPGMDMHIWPMIHPSYGMRSGDKRLQKLLERDWQRLWEHKHDYIR